MNTYTALELHARLKYLTLTGYDKEEGYMFIGDDKQWTLSENYIDCGGEFCDMCHRVECSCDDEYNNQF